MEKKAIIIDDEKAAIDNLKWQLKQFCPEVFVIGEAQSLAEGLELIKSVNCDVIFLDIDLIDGTGFDFIEQAGPLKAEVIFVTGSDEYALKAFEASAIGYIVKPTDPELLAKAVSKVKPDIETYIEERVALLLENYKQEQQQLKKIIIPRQDGVEMILIEDIIYCEAAENYSHIMRKGDKHKFIISKNLGDLSKLLPSYFYRAHKSYIVNLHNAVRYVKIAKGGHLCMVDGTVIPVARRRKDQLMQLINKLS